MDTITLELSIAEANAILAALGEQPYLKVVDLIQKIQEQGARQLQGQSRPEVSESQFVGEETFAEVEHGK